MAETHCKPSDPRFKDLEGKRYGRLLVLSYAGRIGKSNVTAWNCLCDCGKQKVVRGNCLSRGNTRSCGCATLEAVKNRYLRHGMSETRIHATWVNIRQRCNNPNNKTYDRYGGRGIKVCDRWEESFEAFLEDMGPRPSAKHSIDRIDNDGDYCPENCRWVTHYEQQQNRSDLVYLELDGVRHHLTDWARITGISYGTLYGRVQSGWTDEDALTRGVRRKSENRILNPKITS